MKTHTPMLAAALALLGSSTGATAQTLPTPQPPLPMTMSAEARSALQAAEQQSRARPASTPMSIATMRGAADAEQQRLGNEQLRKYDVKLTKTTWGGVPALIFDPAKPRADRRKKLLLNFHGGGFVVDSGSMTENVRLAALSGTRVVSILYRLAPEHPFPAAVDDAVAAYRETIAHHRPRDVVVYGTSAGAILSAELMVRLRRERLPLPAAVGTFSLTADSTRSGDSEGYLPPLAGIGIPRIVEAYVGKTAPSDPVVSPLFSDLRGTPPTLVIASTRDQLLSQSAIYHRALLRSGVDADLIVFEGLPHAFWTSIDCPETDEAFMAMNAFFQRHLGD